ncbi:crAss001_48 related protein [Herbaspirillum rubrisubalbicans]|uniref:Uncharacterized protein n=1 Tax=Herbaspirillum rubrisubalbicans TaxID=80842 RepID=A0AAD0U4D8_9BURK|nr:hypothetical protein [Herbaspirillum rubrisubalbicans]AYR23012.1 hypothetical protein RC54_03895 [Herbaspirillum rubrisubalbicans]
MTKHYIGTKNVLAWPEVKDGKEGYAVKYSDGYTSWSPKDVFEAAYIDIGHVGHLPPHQQRVVGEKAELDDKLIKLTGFIGTPIFAGLDELEQGRMREQARFMLAYSNTLGARIAAF